MHRSLTRVALRCARFHVRTVQTEARLAELGHTLPDVPAPKVRRPARRD